MDNQSRSFDLVAEAYLRARSGYPAALFDHIYESASLSAASHILEVGCGSGQATLAFAGRGSRVVAVDPAKNALDLLETQAQGVSNLDLVHSAFESFETKDEFDLVASAQAFHWLDLATAPIRFADLLKPGGHVALFWHLQDVNPDSPQGDLYRLSSKFFKSFPVLNPPEYGREFIDAMAEVLEQSDHFGPTTITEYPWQQAYEGGMFKVLFRSASNYARLDAGAQGEIEAELENHIAGLSGDPVINYRTCLIMARSNGPQG